jgi:hypothetical protein
MFFWQFIQLLQEDIFFRQRKIEYDVNLLTSEIEKQLHFVYPYQEHRFSGVF